MSELIEAIEAKDADRARAIARAHPEVVAERDDQGLLPAVHAGADVNATERGGVTSLHAAAESGDRELARLLLARGADPSTVDEQGRRPADLAEANGHDELAEELRAAAR